VRIVLVGLLLAAYPAVSLGQFTSSGDDKGPKLGDTSTQRIRIGVIVQASGGLLHHIVATTAVPGEWPEQQVQIVNEDTNSSVQTLDYRPLGGGAVRQMVIEAPQLPAGREAKAVVTFEVTRRTLVAPASTDLYKIPKKLDRQLTMYCGSSPFIESRHPKVIAAAKEAVEGATTDWNKVEAIYDWARDHVAYKQGDLKGAARALVDKEGDTDELVSVFIAMCRSQKIPARTVFVPGHCYAEFYLEDDEGKGHWFPCQPAGVRAFGGIDERRPILQKGDNYKNPENPKERLRFLKDFFTCAGRGGEPKIEFVSELVAE
jgi:hypothetical protein